MTSYMFMRTRHFSFVPRFCAPDDSTSMVVTLLLVLSVCDMTT